MSITFGNAQTAMASGTGRMGSGGGMPVPSGAQIQKLLDENAALIQTIQELQHKGKAHDCMSYHVTLHRNLVYLASLADPQHNIQSLLPPPHVLLQMAPTGHGGPPVDGTGPAPTSAYDPVVGAYGTHQQPVMANGGHMATYQQQPDVNPTGASYRDGALSPQQSQQWNQPRMPVRGGYPSHGHYPDYPPVTVAAYQAPPPGGGYPAPYGPSNAGPGYTAPQNFIHVGVVPPPGPTYGPHSPHVPSADVYQQPQPPVQYGPGSEEPQPSTPVPPPGHPPSSHGYPAYAGIAGQAAYPAVSPQGAGVYPPHEPPPQYASSYRNPQQQPLPQPQQQPQQQQQQQQQQPALASPGGAPLPVLDPAGQHTPPPAVAGYANAQSPGLPGSTYGPPATAQPPGGYPVTHGYQQQQQPVYQGAPFPVSGTPVAQYPPGGYQYPQRAPGSPGRGAYGYGYGQP